MLVDRYHYGKTQYIVGRNKLDCQVNASKAIEFQVKHEQRNRLNGIYKRPKGMRSWAAMPSRIES